MHADGCEGFFVPKKRRRVAWTKPELLWVRQYVEEEANTRGQVSNRWVRCTRAGKGILLPHRTAMSVKDAFRCLQKGSYVESFDIHPIVGFTRTTVVTRRKEGRKEGGDVFAAKDEHLSEKET